LDKSLKYIPPYQKPPLEIRQSPLNSVLDEAVEQKKKLKRVLFKHGARDVNKSTGDTGIGYGSGGDTY
jgi:hypothetical protein